ncbi:MAG TPA: hypothetical protein VEC12_12715 [Bacteroidia bacterium]|nr:hypothetical protein [Bacteroidia bacterium]
MKTGVTYLGYTANLRVYANFFIKQELYVVDSAPRAKATGLLNGSGK